MTTPTGPGERYVHPDHYKLLPPGDRLPKTPFTRNDYIPVDGSGAGTFKDPKIQWLVEPGYRKLQRDQCETIAWLEARGLGFPYVCIR